MRGGSQVVTSVPIQGSTSTILPLHEILLGTENFLTVNANTTNTIIIDKLNTIPTSHPHNDTPHRSPHTTSATPTLTNITHRPEAQFRLLRRRLLPALTGFPFPNSSLL
ncbi:hypothetical protein M409DRAFT_19480 [Zasmidium cellare ATCC 36951]|uniref:Uncharacterized protein n=1 Tax=Zasmidium cellare ATCC 36951 TaxID=1080233 RepID=A0A6A6CZ73_ZASCE|nr:uncharacterized protein M409DRAFT_19480 [Zasmidium cellare ATCC 36951]KAF2170666.1 hypothetical protein M409DRAFT_19480 [Zasmidium cellare ATCC 36951]